MSVRHQSAVLGMSVLVLFSTVSLGQTNSKSTPAANAQTSADECGCDEPIPEVVATVNGIKITRQELTSSQARIKELKDQIVSARQKELDLQINSQLLNEEAQKQGVTPSKLLENEVVAKIAEPTEAEAKAFFEENKTRLSSQDFAALQKDIIEYLRNQRQLTQAKAFADRLRAAAQIKMSGISVSPPASSAERARVFATVNGKNISSADVEDNLRPMVLSVQKEIYKLRKQEVDLIINDKLLNQEATKKSVTTHALLESEVQAKVHPISDAEAQKFYDENKSRINGEFATVKPQVIQYLEEQARTAAEENFAGQLRGVAIIQTFLKAPVDDNATKP